VCCGTCNVNVLRCGDCFDLCFGYILMIFIVGEIREFEDVHDILDI